MFSMDARFWTFCTAAALSRMAKKATKQSAPWNRANPRQRADKTPRHLSAAKKSAAKARAKRAGRPYPNLVDNMGMAKTARKKKAKKTAKKKPAKTGSARKSSKKTVERKKANALKKTRLAD